MERFVEVDLRGAEFRECDLTGASWTQTVDRVRRMPTGSEFRRVDDEWSAVETLRHLVFVHDSWFRRCCRGLTEPFTPLGLASGGESEQLAHGLDPAAAPSLDDVVAVWTAQATELREWLGTASTAELNATAPVPEDGRWPPYARGRTVGQCLRTVLDEVWAHHGFCVRDLNQLPG